MLASAYMQNSYGGPHFMKMNVNENYCTRMAVHICNKSCSTFSCTLLAFCVLNNQLYGALNVQKVIK
jgi:hypothetical protein